MYPKDIAILTGKSVKTGNNIINKIKKIKGKKKHQAVTIDEVCEYLDIDIEIVTSMLKSN
tara:strand:- start:25014 stop:25193 length:180 start_codon:yes stop_codon:yes gene_type:complete